MPTSTRVNRLNIKSLFTAEKNFQKINKATNIASCYMSEKNVCLTSLRVMSLEACNKHLIPINKAVNELQEEQQKNYPNEKSPRILFEGNPSVEKNVSLRFYAALTTLTSLILPFEKPVFQNPEFEPKVKNKFKETLIEIAQDEEAVELCRNMLINTILTFEQFVEKNPEGFIINKLLEELGEMLRWGALTGRDDLRCTLYYILLGKKRTILKLCA